MRRAAVSPAVPVRSLFVAAIVAACPCLATRSAVAQSNLLASVRSDGKHGNDQSSSPAISPDGRYVAFQSNANTLDVDDPNFRQDIYWHDLETGVTEVVSKATDGTLGDHMSSQPRISQDGAFVVFLSLATNLAPGDTHHRQDVFLHEVATGITTRVSVATDGTEADDHSFDPGISADGTRIVFSSPATNLVAGDTNARSDVFLHDTTTGTTERISLDSAGNEADGASGKPTISADGKLVVFESTADDLVPGDTNRQMDVFLRDLDAGTTIRLDHAFDGSESKGSAHDAAISADGRFVTFVGYPDDLVPLDTNNRSDIFVVEIATLATERVSVNSDGQEANQDCFGPSISGDGRWVGFGSYATDLVDDGGAFAGDAYIRDRALGMTSPLVTEDGDLLPPNAHCYAAGFSDDGARVAFASAASNLVANDVNDKSDVFVRQRNLTPASVATYGSGFPGTLGEPAIAVSGPPVLHRPVDLLVDDSSSWYTVAVLVAGRARFDAAAWGGRLLVEPDLLLPIALSPGTNTLPLAMPDEDLVSGVVVDLQVLELDAGAAHGVSLTAGLELTLGL